MANTNDAVSTADREFVITRIVNAPRELVYKVWTGPEHLALWWGPEGFTNTILEMNVRPGGVCRLIMHGHGTDFPNRLVFSEVVAPARLAYLHDSGDDNDPGRFHVVVTFDDLGAKTRITMRAVFATAAHLDRVIREYGALESGNQTINRMEAYLAAMEGNTTGHGETSLFLSRLLNAPRELVYRTWTEPEHVAAWWGPEGFTNTITEMEVKPGGAWNLIMHGPDGTDYRNESIYKEVIPPSRLVFSHITGPRYEMSVDFVPVDGKTLIRIHMIFESAEQLEKVITVFRADDGLTQNIDRLSAYLAGMPEEI